MATLVLTPGVSSAAPEGKSDGTIPALASCVGEAKAQRAEAWVCTSSGLTTVSSQGVETFLPIRPSVNPITETGTGFSISADDYDYWCENGSICHRKINTYAEETKGNAAYGDLTGVIGTFDVILRTNLNGRQAQWKLSLIWDSGPGLSFEDSGVSCYEEINNWPDTNCGNHFAGTPRISSAGWRWDSGTLYGNRLANSNEYYGAANGDFKADGYQQYFIMGALESSYFYCYGSDPCRF
jgi:hypothetical protein